MGATRVRLLPRGAARVLTATLASLALIVLAGILLVRQPALARRERVVAGAADEARLRRHVEFLARDAAPRDVGHPENLLRARDYIEAELAAAGARVRRQQYVAQGQTFWNVVAELGPEGNEPFVVGAHYDACCETCANPGADDNASGVAGLFETARLLAPLPLARPLVLVAYSTEEPPFFFTDAMGSAVHAASLRRAGTRIAGMVSLEMLGYYAPKQPLPNPLFGLAYPSRGEFIAVVGRWADRRLARDFRRGIDAASATPAYSYSGPIVSGIEASDHASYWTEGYTAIMVTDTAFLRNPNYHEPTDTPDTLDYRRMAEVVTGIANATALRCGTRHGATESGPSGRPR
jgi:hypothetical protein